MQNSFYLPKEQAQKLELLLQYYRSQFGRRVSKSSVVADSIDFFYHDFLKNGRISDVQEGQQNHESELTPIEQFIKEQSDE
jgi:hypothetical protein